MKNLAGLLPWAVVLALIGAVIWFVQQQNPAAGRLLLVGLLVAHGLVHVLYLVPQPVASAGGPPWPFDLARAWPVSTARLDPRRARAIATALIAVVVVGFGLAGLATAGLVFPAAWWSTLVAASAVVSLLLLGTFFHPQLLVGIALDLALLWIVALTTWRPSPG